MVHVPDIRLWSSPRASCKRTADVRILQNHSYVAIAVLIRMVDQSVQLFPHFQPSYLVLMPPATGAHTWGGADEILNRSFYVPAVVATDPCYRFAGHEQGAASILGGIAGGASIQRNTQVNLLDLVSLRPEATNSAN